MFLWIYLSVILSGHIEMETLLNGHAQLITVPVLVRKIAASKIILINLTIAA